MMRGVEHVTAPEETMEGVEIVLIEGRLVQGFDGAVQVPIMGVTEALYMIGTVAHHMTGPGTGALIMGIRGDSEGIDNYSHTSNCFIIRYYHV